MRRATVLDKHLIATTYPVAGRGNFVFWKNYRITVLQSRLFRLEQSPKLRFRDSATQSVWYRNMPLQDFTVSEKDGALIVDTGDCRLLVSENRDDCRMLIDGNLLPICNEGNLGGTYRTLDGCDGNLHHDFETGEEKEIVLGTGVCSRTGVAVLDDGNSLSLGEDGLLSGECADGTDEYIFAYGKDYRAAVRALYLITGKPPLLPRYVLGNWWSRWHSYTDREYLKLLEKFRQHEIPLTVATLDMDWHYSEEKDIDETFGVTALSRNSSDYLGEVTDYGGYGWTGYTWNEKLFPDYKTFLKETSERGLAITLNLHPASGVRYWERQYSTFAKAVGADENTAKAIPFRIDNPIFINTYFSVLHKPYEADGVSFWWLDWQQGETWGETQTDPLWALNHYHYLDHAKNHVHPVILSRYAGVGSHRYPIGFSGDTFMTWKTLDYLPYFTATASNIGYTEWSHDIGGHYKGETDGELFVRHLQFGVFSPINRLHCSNWDTMTKEPWVYGNGAGLIAAEWLRLRHKLIPFLYSCNDKTHREGRALIEPLYYEYPDCKEAYSFLNEYFFGGLLVAPITTPRAGDGYACVKGWIPEGIWTDVFTGDRYVSPVGGMCKILLRTLDSIPVLAKEGTLLPLSCDIKNGCVNPSALQVKCYAGNGEFTLYEDDESGVKHFIEFSSENTVLGEQGKQRVKIIAYGDSSVIPQNRTITLCFVDIKDGAVKAYRNGKEQEQSTLLSDCVSVELNFRPDIQYTVEVVYDVVLEEQYRTERAIRILSGANGSNLVKHNLQEAICRARTKEEYRQTVEQSELSEGVKLRLIETL